MREQYDSSNLYDEKYNGAIVITCALAVILGMMEFGAALPNLTQILKARSAGSILFEVIERKPEISYEDFDSSIDVAGLTPEIEMKNVTFSYPVSPDIPVLKNFSFTFRPGTTTAIVGPTGSGKSTIVQLIESSTTLKKEASRSEEHPYRISV